MFVVSLSLFDMILGLVLNSLLCVCYCEFVCKFVFLGGCHDNLSMLQLFCDYLNISLYGGR